VPTWILPSATPYVRFIFSLNFTGAQPIGEQDLNFEGLAIREVELLYG
jgi:hypothetical protein